MVHLLHPHSSPRQRRLMLNNPASTVQEARKWASNSLPRLIVFAIGLHLVFSALLVTQLQGINQANLQEQEDASIAEQDQEIEHDIDNGEPQRLIATAAQLPPSTNTQELHEKEAPRQTLRLSKVQTGTTFVPEDVILEKDELYVRHVFDMNEKLKRKFNVTHAVSCRWRQPQSHSIYSENCAYHANAPHYDNQNDDLLERRVVLFNPMDQERILCDGSRLRSAEIRVLPPGQSDLNCSEPPRLYQEVPTLSTKQEMNPIELRFRDRQDKLYDFPCDVPCQSDQGGGVLAQRRVAGTPFSIQHSMEGPHYYNMLKFNPLAHRYNRFYSTTSFQSEIPLPYFSFEEYGDTLQAGPAVDYETAIKGAVFMARNCNSRNNREGLVRSLLDSKFRVDSVSQCMKNAEKPDGAENRKDILRHYLFYLAFENQCENDYITEKLWTTLEAGVVPVYYGAPNVEEHVPKNSVLNANSFETSQALAEYLNKVASDKDLYESYHAWRKLPLPESFSNKYKFTEVHSTCRTCRWAFAKKYGLGWNHTLQTVEDVRISRQTCHDNHAVLTHPFHETWLSGDASNILVTSEGKRSTPQTCATRSTHFQKAIQLGDQTLIRSVRSQDGVTDILLDRDNSTFVRSESVVLQMKTPIMGDANSLVTLSEFHYRFQDSTNRFTILTSRKAEVSTPGMGMVALRVSNLNAPIQIRVIVENIDNLYDDMVNRTNYFGRIMTEDFLNPLEKFVVWGSPKNESDWVGKQLLSAGIISTTETKEEMEDEETMAREEEERKEAKHEEAEAIRAALIKVQDDVKTERDSLAMRGVKKLIEMGIIEVTYSDDENK